MHTDWVLARRTLPEGSYTCVLCQNGKVYTSTLRGVAPLLHWLENGTVAPGFFAADKVVGKATAFLYCLLGARAVYADVMSSSALEVLQNHSITADYSQKVDHIRNRQGDGMCPMEAATMDISDPQTALQAVYRTMEALRS